MYSVHSCRATNSEGACVQNVMRAVTFGVNNAQSLSLSFPPPPLHQEESLTRSGTYQEHLQQIQRYNYILYIRVSFEEYESDSQSVEVFILLPP